MVSFLETNNDEDPARRKERWDKGRGLPDFSGAGFMCVSISGPRLEMIIQGQMERPFSETTC